MKTCSRCMLHLDDDHFYHAKQPSGIIYLLSPCKSCRTTLYRQYRKGFYHRKLKPYPKDMAPSADMRIGELHFHNWIAKLGLLVVRVSSGDRRYLLSYAGYEIADYFAGVFLIDDLHRIDLMPAQDVIIRPSEAIRVRDGKIVSQFDDYQIISALRCQPNDLGIVNSRTSLKPGDWKIRLTTDRGQLIVVVFDTVTAFAGSPPEIRDFLRGQTDDTITT